MTTQPFSYVDLDGDGTTQNYQVPFPYLDRNHINVYVDDSPMTFTWIDSGNIRTDAPPPAGTKNIRIKRTTPANNLLVVFSSPSDFKSIEVNKGYRQLLYIIQEAFDSALEALDIARQVQNALAAALAAIDEIEAIFDDVSAIAADIESRYAQILLIWQNSTVDLTFNLPYRISRGEIVATYQFTEQWTIPANASGSRAWSLTQPAADTVIKLSRRAVNSEVDVALGTVTLRANFYTGVFSSFSEVTFAPGETLVLTRDIDGDEALKNWGMTLRTHRLPPS